MVQITYFTQLNWQICDYAQKRRICRENCEYALYENFHGHFCPPRKAAKFCHPGTRTVFLSWIFQNWRKMNVSANELSCCYYRHTIHKSAQSKNNCQPPTPKHKIKDSSNIFYLIYAPAGKILIFSCLPPKNMPKKNSNSVFKESPTRCNALTCTFTVQRTSSDGAFI